LKTGINLGFQCGEVPFITSSQLAGVSAQNGPIFEHVQAQSQIVLVQVMQLFEETLFEMADVKKLIS